MKLLTRIEAAARLGFRSDGPIRRLEREGRLQLVRPTGRRAVRILEADLERLIADLRGVEGERLA